MSVNFSLEGKIAFVTGASYGIGFAIASGMAKAGAKIVFNDIKQELVDKGLAAYKEAGIDAHGYVCDVTNEEAVNATVEKITKEVGPIDILVNNAGIIKRIPMCDMTAAEFRQVIDVDLNAPFIVSKAVIPSMIERGHGKIINICSMMSELGRETFLDGKKFNPKEHLIGYLPEERGLYPKKKVSEQLVYLGRLRGLSKVEAKKNTDKWLKRLQVSQYTDVKLETLSKGNQQKVQLASTLVCEPEIVILDEPFSGLDPVNSKILQDVVTELIEEGRIVIFSISL